MVLSKESFNYLVERTTLDPLIFQSEGRYQQGIEYLHLSDFLLEEVISRRKQGYSETETLSYFKWLISIGY